jgi:hypothetical protein
MSDDNCPFSWLMRDPYAEARAFYGPAFEAVARAEKEAREFQRLRAETAPSRVDDVAHQIKPW